MLEFDPDLEEVGDPDLEVVGDRPLADSLGDTSRELLLLQMISWMLMVTGNSRSSQTCMCCEIRSMATVFSAPRGTITSAYFFVGKQNSSKAGFTRVVYWGGGMTI